MRRLLLVVLGVVALAGCGGGEDDDASKPGEIPTIAAADWSKRAEGLCAKGARRAENAVRSVQLDAARNGLSKSEFTARVFEASAESTSPLVGELAALPLPRGREDQARRFVRLLEETLPLFERNATALRRGDQATVERTNDRVLEIAGVTRRLARDLGIARCIPARA